MELIAKSNIPLESFESLLNELKILHLELKQNSLKDYEQKKLFAKLEKLVCTIKEQIIPNINDANQKSKLISACADIFYFLNTVVKNDTDNHGEIPKILTLESELNSILGDIYLKYKGKKIIDEIDVQINHFFQSLNVADLNLIENNIISRIDKFLEQNPNLNRKDLLLETANRITYKYWREGKNDFHHDNVFCNNQVLLHTIDKKEFDLFITSLIDYCIYVEKTYNLDVFHFFAAYSAYRAQIIKHNDAELLKFIHTFKIVTGLNTTAPFDKIADDLSPAFFQAYWYTLGGDLLQDCSRSNFNFYIPQIAIDYMALLSLENDHDKNQFDIKNSIIYFFALIKNKDLKYKESQFHIVSEEMFYNFNPKKYRLDMMSTTWKLGKLYYRFLKYFN